MKTYNFTLFRDGAFVARVALDTPDRVSAWAALAIYAQQRRLDYDRAMILPSDDVSFSQARESVYEHLRAEGAQDIVEITRECRKEVPGYSAGMADRAVQSLVDERLIQFVNGRFSIRSED